MYLGKKTEIKLCYSIGLEEENLDCSNYLHWLKYATRDKVRT